MSIDPWPTSFDFALWIRAVERIPAPAGGLIPGPMDLDPIPPASKPRLDKAEGVDGWTHWWGHLLDIPPTEPRFIATAWDSEQQREPTFPWLMTWPDLHRDREPMP